MHYTKSQLQSKSAIELTLNINFEYFCSEVAGFALHCVTPFPVEPFISLPSFPCSEPNANTLGACVCLNQKDLEGRNDSNIVVRFSPVPARVCVLFSSKQPGTCGHFERHE